MNGRMLIEFSIIVKETIYQNATFSGHGSSSLSTQLPLHPHPVLLLFKVCITSPYIPYLQCKYKPNLNLLH